MKYSYTFQKYDFCEKMALSYICSSFFNIQLNRGHLDPHICLYIQSVAISHVLYHLETFTVYSYNSKKEQKRHIVS